MFTYNCIQAIKKYKLRLVHLKGVGWDTGGKLQPGDYYFFSGKEEENLQPGTGFLCLTE
jgi:hypothetical protein